MSNLNIRTVYPALYIPEFLLHLGLSSRAILVYGRLAHYAYIGDGDGSECWPSHDTLASDLGRSVDTIRRALRELKKKELISIIHPEGKDILAHRNNTYIMQDCEALSGACNGARPGVCRIAHSGPCNPAHSNNCTTYNHNIKSNRTKEYSSRARTHARASAKAGLIETGRYSPEFAEAWDEYDKKQDKARAWKEWRKLNEQDRADAMEAIPSYVRSTPDKKWRKKFCHFLRDRIWEDEEFEEAEQEQEESSAHPIKLGKRAKVICKQIRKTMEESHGRPMDEDDMVPVRLLACRLEFIIRRQRQENYGLWMLWSTEGESGLVGLFCSFLLEHMPKAVHPNALLPDKGAAWRAFWKYQWSVNDEMFGFESYEEQRRVISGSQ